MSNNRNLKKSAGRPYQLRLSLDQGKAFNRLRVTIPLNTHDIAEARERRDCILVAYEKASVLHFPT